MSVSLPLVIEPEQLAGILDDPSLLILDLSSAENYQQGHIPGAIRVDPKRLLRGEGPVPNKIPSAEQLSALFSELGLTPDRQVVVYDDQLGPWAGRMIWTLHCCGHLRASFLNGQLDAWRERELPLELNVRQPEPSQFNAQIDRRLIADASWIVEHLDDADLLIWDARSADEYSGAKVVNAKQGGHIPGARHLEWTDTLEDGPVRRLRDPDALRETLANAGISGKHTVVTHCQTHRRSGLTYIVGRWLGFEDIRCYDGSWFEWGNNPELPVER